MSTQKNEVQKKLIKPLAGKTVIDPTSLRKLPEKGLNLEVTTYWLRRERDGDVSIEGRENPQAEKPTTEKTK